MSFKLLLCANSLLSVLDLIDNHHLVTDVYGTWPSFVNADMLNADITTFSERFDDCEPRQLDLTLHWWLGAHDHYPDGPRHFDESELHRRIHLVFFAEDIRIRTFHCSDTSIDELTFSRRGDQLDIQCGGGFELQVIAHGARVLSVTPCDVLGDAIGT